MSNLSSQKEEIATINNNFNKLIFSEKKTDHEQKLKKIETDLKKKLEKITLPLVPNSKKKTSIIIVTYNSAETIGICLDSILKNIRNDDEIVIVDNFSQDQTIEILNTYNQCQQIKTIFSPKNLGFSGGVNLGVSSSVNESLILLNPDTIVTEFWIDKLLNVLYSKENIAAVGPISNYAAGYQGTPSNNIFLSDILNISEMAKVVGILKKELIIDSKILIGFCLAIKREKFEEINLLPENMPLGLDDLALSWQLREKGYELKIVADAYVHHKGQVSFKSAGKKIVNKLETQSIYVMANKLFNYYCQAMVVPPEILWGISWYRTPDKEKFREMFAKIPDEYPVLERVKEFENDKQLVNIWKIAKNMFLGEEVSFHFLSENFSKIDLEQIKKDKKVFVINVASEKKDVFLEWIICNKFEQIAVLPTQTYKKYDYQISSENVINSKEINSQELFILSKEIEKTKIKPLISIVLSNNYSEIYLNDLILFIEKQKQISPFFWEIIIPFCGEEKVSIEREKVKLKYFFFNVEEDFSLNQIIEKADGEWLYFLKDNTLPADGLPEKLIQSLISIDDPDIALQGRVIPAGEEKYFRRSNYYRQNLFIDNTFASEFIFNNLCISKKKCKDLITRALFNESLVSTELIKNGQKNLFLYDLICFEKKSRTILEHFNLNRIIGKNNAEIKNKSYSKEEIKKIKNKKNILEIFRNFAEKYDFNLGSETVNFTVIDSYFNLAYQQGLLEGLKEYDEKFEQKQPLISVVMSTYNNERTISAAIESILNQTYKNLELIIIDDGSSSNSVSEIVKDFISDSRVKYFYQQNRGIPAARNRGIIEAKGKYIKFADADDLVLPFGLEILVRAAEQETEQYQIIYADYIIYKENYDVYEYSKMSEPVAKPELYVKHLTGNFIPVGATIVRREAILELNLLDEMLNGTDDFDLWNRIFSHYENPVLKVPVNGIMPIYIYYVHGEQFSQNLETIKCYTDTSCLKLIERINLAGIDIYEVAINMFKRYDTPYEAAIKLLSFSENQNNKNMIYEAILANNEIFPDLFTSKELEVKDFSEIEVIVSKNNNFPQKLFKLFTKKDEQIIPFFCQFSKTLLNFSDYLILFFRTDFPIMPAISARFINSNIDQLFINSQVGKKMLEKYRIISDKAVVIPTFINHQIFKPSEKPRKLATEKNFRFIFRNHLTFQKGIDLLIEAYLTEFSEKDDVCLVIKFDQIYDFEMYEKIKRIANRQNQAEILILEESIAKEEISSLYGACDCYVAPLRFPDNDPYLLEAMACGIPVITTEGTNDFCLPDNSFLIKSAWKYDEGIFIPGIQAANDFIFLQPNIENLKENLRKVQQKPEILLNIISSAQKIASDYSQENTFLALKIALSQLNKKSIFRKNPEILKKRILEEGLNAFNQKNYLLAEEKFSDLVIIERENEDFIFNLGLSRYQLGKYEEALENFSECLELNGLNSNVCNYLASCLEKTGETDLAADFYQKARELAK